MEEEIVSNASSIIFIGKLNIFNLVKNLYTKIIIPEEVMEEIFKYDRPECNLIKKELDSGFLKKTKIKNLKDLPLHIGEKSSISLCLEKKISIFMSDDKKARSYARSLDLAIIGVLGIIFENLRLKHIDKNQAKQLIEKLIDTGYYMSPKLYFEVLELINSY